jgi:hypothetical protein
MTAFELYAQHLGLTEYEGYAAQHCGALRRWCAANMYRKYVPEILLNAWKLYVDPEDERLYGKESND